jgi:hypothetical protein
MKFFKIDQASLFLTVSLILLFHCKTVNQSSVKSADGTPNLRAEDVYKQFSGTSDRFTNSIEPLIAGRCVTCHECVEAPCQLKLSSYDGMRRGSTKNRLGASIGEVLPTRIKDEKNWLHWRNREFSSIFPDSPTESRTDNNNQSVMFQALQNGMKTNVAGFNLSSLQSYYTTDAQICPATTAEHHEFLKENPAAGMPLGFTHIPDAEFKALTDWIGDGAPGPTDDARAIRESTKNPDTLLQWESLLNRSSPKERLAARYLFEHFAYIHFHFSDSYGEFFELVRSSTPAPRPISEIVTDTPSAAPLTSSTYRFKKVTDVIVQKTHIVYEASKSKLARIKELFFSADWQPLPKDYLITYTGNPFDDFQKIPTKARATFMLENSRMIFDQIIRGPVCSGRAATYAIRDHFWVMFMDPSSDPSVADQYLGMQQISNDFVQQDEPISTSYFKISEYQKRFEKTLRNIRPQGLSLKDVWTGGPNRSDNALLTIFRHDESVSLHRGWIGGNPESITYLSYSNFERIFYALAVQFKFWGSVPHKLNSWSIMRKVREEAEALTISLLPEKNRKTLEVSWAKGLAKFLVPEDYNGRTSQIEITHDNNPFGDLINQIRPLFTDAQTRLSEDDFNFTLLDANGNSVVGVSPTLSEFERNLRSLVIVKYKAIFEEYLPPIAHIRYYDPTSKQYSVYTIISHDKFYHHENPLISNSKRIHMLGDGTLSIFRGILGDYSYIYFDIDSREKGAAFVKDILALKTATAYENLKNHYGVRRNNENFWAVADWMVNWNRQENPIEGGIIDLSKYDRNDLKQYDVSAKEAESAN